MYGDVFKGRGEKYNYAIKVINIEKMDDDVLYWQKANTLENLEKEAEITRKMGELGIGPRLFDVYYCEDKGVPKYYFMMEHMNQGSLKIYLKKSKMKKTPAAGIP